MKNLSKAFIVIAICISVAISSVVSFASTDTLTMVENIIAGKQDKLIFATIVSIGNNICSVEVMEEIGEDKKAEADSDTDGRGDAKSIVGEKIEVEGLRSYMYYDGFDHRPKIGDNLLLSLTFSGNTYKIKNGAFYVNAASHDTFNFIVPDTIDNTPGAMELTALYRFVGSNGKNADYSIRDSVVYTHDTANNGVEIRITEQEGISFVNEKGETTKEAESGIPADSEANNHDYGNRWIWAAVILVFGSAVGLLVVNMILKYEKRSESK